MKIIWKSAAALALTAATLGAAVVPAQAHDGRHGWRGDRHDRWEGRRWSERRWEGRRWDDRRHWRGHRDWRDDQGWRGDGRRYAYRQRCWTDWRYDYYRDRNVRVRVCR